MNTLMIIGAIVVGLILLIITAGVVTYIIHKKTLRNMQRTTTKLFKSDFFKEG
ncbi:hypothetical protein HCB26_06110 [Listeria booriae]|uniref:Uncharacterized protein n=1 Tax=Listeria booriae TaxID=1552123 RepID=A0A7X0YYW4_9LIST|nr:hypothetical protein [Listeria booriae]MBC2166139.1 hypothetical protein [Listeria booriae]